LRLRIEALDKQGTRNRKYEVSGRKIPRVTSAFQDRLSRPGFERLHHDFCVVPPSEFVGCRTGKRKKDSISGRQNLWSVETILILDLYKLFRLTTIRRYEKNSAAAGENDAAFVPVHP